MKIFESFGQNWAKIEKIPFYKNVILNKANFCKKGQKIFIFKIHFLIIFMVCIFVTILVPSTSILTISWAKIVKKINKDYPYFLYKSQDPES